MKKNLFANLIPSLTTDFVIVYRIAIIGIVITGFLFIKFSLDSEEKNIENKVIAAAEQIEKITASNIDYVKYQIYYAANQIKLVGTNEQRIAKLLATFVTNINNQIDSAITWNAFSWINNYDKLTVDGAAGVLTRPIDLSSRDYLPLAVKNHGKLVFGKPVKGALSQRLIIPAGAAVLSDNESYLGTLVFGLDIERISAKLENIVGNETISFAFLNDKEIILTSSNFDNKNLPLVQEALTLTSLNDKLSEKKFLSTQNLFTKKTPFALLHKMHEYPFKIIVFHNEEKSYQQLLNILFKQFFLILSIAFACIILFKQIYQKIVQPVSSLSDFALKISKRDFSATMPKPESKELANLYNTLQLVKESFEREQFLIHKLEGANKKISQENSNKTEFLASVSHELRNPLAAITSFANFISEESEGPIKDYPEKYKEFATDIESCSSDLMQFVNDLVDVNRAQSGEFSVNLSQKIDIADIIKRSLKITHNFAHRRRILIKTNIQPDLENIALDPVRMKQVLVNLISNSLKYSPENTEVLISAKSMIEFDGSKKLQISIKDNGFGMTEEQVKKSTEKYNNIENKNCDKIDSFGLGLALTKYLVETQKGKFEIKSKINNGTEITLTFFYF